jgi:succinate dehydrogenase flavin-adding protein (antitoxin of CptAB toxin-antitoxin module)
MNKPLESLFDKQKKEAELKVMLSNVLDDLDDYLSSAFHEVILDLTDKDLIELIVENKENIKDQKKVVQSFLKMLCKKSPNFKKQVQSSYGREFLIKNKIL